MGWPGWPPGLRLSCPRGGGGLTTSEEGGLEEAEESLRAAASCSSKRVTAACNRSSCSCNRWHPAQGFVAASAILTVYSLLPDRQTGPERSRLPPSLPLRLQPR